MADEPLSGRKSRLFAQAKPSLPRWSKIFLDELAATSSLSAAARKANIATATAYEARRNYPEFNQQWQKSLYDGYDHFLLKLLNRQRVCEVKPASGAKLGVRAIDNATAFRLLAAHHESASHPRVIRDNQDAESIVQSINGKLETMRQRMLAEVNPKAEQIIDQSADSPTQ